MAENATDSPDTPPTATPPEPATETPAAIPPAARKGRALPAPTTVVATIPSELTDVLKNLSTTNNKTNEIMERMIAAGDRRDQVQTTMATTLEGLSRATETRNAPSTDPARVEVTNPEPKKSIVWDILVLIALAAIAVLVYSIRHSLSSKTADMPSQTSESSKTEKVTELKTELKRDVADTKVELTKLDKAVDKKIEVVKNDLESKIAVATKNMATYEANEIPRSPAKEVAGASKVKYVNILLIDDFGRTATSFKEVPVSDANVSADGRGVRFQYGRGPNYWAQEAVFSYEYTANDPPITGSIVYTPAIAGAASEVINVSPCDVYIGKDGTIRYDNHGGFPPFPVAPKGASYITTQLTMPRQP